VLYSSGTKFVPNINLKKFHAEARFFWTARNLIALKRFLQRANGFKFVLIFGRKSYLVIDSFLKGGFFLAL